jgi:hypothetical protein
MSLQNPTRETKGLASFSSVQVRRRNATIVTAQQQATHEESGKGASRGAHEEA